jgi:hypothetical protein
MSTYQGDVMSISEAQNHFSPKRADGMIEGGRFLFSFFFFICYVCMFTCLYFLIIIVFHGLNSSVAAKE